jgi:hypothetical protein
VKTFNFIEAAGLGYQFIWDQRRLLASLAVLPLSVKFGCVALIILLGLQDNYLRQGLLLLPGYFMEGWMVAMAIRLALFGETWVPGPNGLRPADDARRLVLASAIFYTLIKVFVTLAAAFLIIVSGFERGTPPPAEPAPGSFVALLTLAFVSVWIFRFLWMNVVIAMNVPLGAFTRSIMQVPISLPMLALWMMCMVPGILILTGVSGLLAPMMSGMTPESPSVSYVFLMSCAEALVELIIALVSGVAMAYAVREFLSGRPDRPRP